MAIGIIGAGAMGGLFGGMLADAGYDVRLYDIDPALVSTINADGLRVESEDGVVAEAAPPAATEPEIDTDLEFTFLFCKSQHTTDAIEDFRPVIDRSRALVTCQNGLSNIYVLRDRLPAEKIYGGYTVNGANRPEPGRVRLLGIGTTVVGGPDRAIADDIVATLVDAGMEAKAVDDPLPHIWDKQFINVGIKPIAALSNLRHGGMATSEDAQAAMRALIEEAMAVAEAKGIERITDDPVQVTIDNISRADKRTKKSSIMEDIENERPTEIEYMTGTIAEFGEEAGVPTPYNWLATRLVQAKEHSYLGSPVDKS